MPEQQQTFPFHILVAEDNPINQMVAQKLLEKLGCTVVVADNGEAAIEQLSANAFDLVLMDCMMPVMDGFTATRTIRASGQAYAQVPIVAFSANALDDDQQACQQAGMDDFIDKPATMDNMVELLSRWSQKLSSNPSGSA